jgi:hypothetical protein
MHRIDTATADADANGTGKAGFRPGAPPGVASTRLDEDWFNAVQEEIALSVEGLGGTLDKTSHKQLLAAIQRQAVKAALASIKLADDLGAGTINAIARSAAGRTTVVGSSSLIAFSTGHDGFTAETAAAASDFVDIVYDATHSLFIAVGSNGSVQTSPGSGTWTQQVTGVSTFKAIATDGAGHSVAVGAGERLWSSANGTSWASRTSPFAGTPDIVSVAFGAGVFVMVTNQGDIASSGDFGITWTVRQALAGSTSGGGGPHVAYHASLGFIYHYVANVYRSADGIAWTQIHNAAQSSTETPGLLVTPYCWMIGRASGGNGTAIDGRFSPTAINAAIDFRADYIVADGLTALKLVDGQLMGVAGSKIFVGGVL